MNYYFIVATLGATWAAIEILSRHKDEPFKVLFSSSYCFLFIALNVAISAGCYYYLTEEWKKVSNLTAVIISAFGAPAFLRSSIFDIQSGDRKVQVGPGFLIDELLRIIHVQIDRKRAWFRLDFVTTTMAGLTFEQASRDAVQLTTKALQLPQDKTAEFDKLVGEIAHNGKLNETEKLQALGFLILDYAGEKFLVKLADKIRLAPSKGG